MSGPRSSLSQCNAAGRAWAGSWAKGTEQLLMLHAAHWRMVKWALNDETREPVADCLCAGFVSVLSSEGLSVGDQATGQMIQEQVEAFQRGALAWFEAYENEHGPVAEPPPWPRREPA